MATTRSKPKTPARRPFAWLSNRDPFGRMRDEMEDLFDHYFPIQRNGNGETFSLSADLDLSETKKAFEIELDVPGIEEENIDISLTESGVLISGKREEKIEEKEKDFHRVERSYGAFQRHVPLPCEIDEAKIEATLSKGVLKVKLPKSKKAGNGHKKIPIQSL